MLRLSALVFFVLAGTNSFAGDHDLAGPHRATWCAALFEAAPSNVSGYQGDLHYHLRSLNGVAISAARRLAERKLTLLEKIGRGLSSADRMADRWIGTRSLFETLRDFTQPNDFEVQAQFLQPQKLKWTYRNKLNSEKLVGRLLQLESDFTRESPDLLSFGYSIRGEQQIKTFIAGVERTTHYLESRMEAQLDAKFPFFRVSRTIHHSITGAIDLAVLYYLGKDFVGAFPHFGPALIPPAILDIVLFRYAFWPGLSSSIDYALGSLGPKLRDRYDRKHDIYRIGNLIASQAQLKTMLEFDKFPDALIYSGFSVTIPTELKKEMLAASAEKRDLNKEILSEAIASDRTPSIEVVDRNFLLVDQMFFFDEQTKEPVLANFVRVKRDLNLPGKHKKPKTQLEASPATESSGVPGMAR